MFIKFSKLRYDAAYNNFILHFVNYDCLKTVNYYAFFATN